MFANHLRPLLAAVIFASVVSSVATAQYRQSGVPSNPNLRRPVPVAAQSLTRQSMNRSQGVVPAARQVPMVDPDSTGRLPPAELSGEPEVVQPRSRGAVIVPEGAAPEIYYDPAMQGGYETHGYGGYQGGYHGGFMQPNAWCAPMMPMLCNTQLCVRGEFLYWWTSPLNTPTLATSSPADVDMDEAGMLGADETRRLFGGELNDDIRPGARFTANLWFDACQNRGLEMSYAFLSTEQTDFNVNSNRLPVIARPFFNVETGEQDAELVAFPDQLTGSLVIAAETSFQTADILYRWNACCDTCRRIDLTLGYRFAYLNDEIRIRERLTSTDLDSGIVPGTTIDVRDGFESTNYFNGVQIGVALQRQTFLGCVDGWLKTSLGNTHTESTIRGRTIVTANGQTAESNQGFLAMGTNIGTRERDEFSTLVELGGKWNYDICNWRASVGYNVLFWSCVGRGGDLIDLQVNTSQLPPGPLEGGPSPRYRERQSCFWAQGVTFGLERCF